jgi:hypothetical protein
MLEIVGLAPAVKRAVQLVTERLRKFGVDRSVLPFFEFTKASAMAQQQQQQPPPMHAPVNAYGIYGNDPYALAAAQGMMGPYGGGACASHSDVGGACEGEREREGERETHRGRA